MLRMVKHAGHAFLTWKFHVKSLTWKFHVKSQKMLKQGLNNLKIHKNDFLTWKFHVNGLTWKFHVKT